jgi:protoporphyrinogen oxidase
MKIAIIGAGAGGMAAAYDLLRAGHGVTIFEAQDGPGGLARGFQDEGWDWSVEKFYHHWFTSDRDIRRLIGELGLGSRVVVRSPVTAVYADGNFYPLDSIPAVLAFPGLPLVDRLRFLLAAGLMLRLNPFWAPLEGITCEEWMLRWLGRRTYETLWKPLLVGKFGEENYRSVNMAWFWARFHSRSRNLVTYEGGMQRFADDFAAKLTAMGATIHYGRTVGQLSALPEGAVQLRVAGREEVFDACLATVAPHALARLAPSLQADYLAGLLTLRHIGAVVLVLALSHPLSPKGIYWHNLPKEAGFPFLAMVEHTNFLPPEKFGGDRIVYCGDYLPPDHEYFKLSKAELVARFLPALKRFNPDFSPEWVRNSWLFKADYAQPIPLVYHSRNIPANRTPMKGLYFACMSQVYPWDRGMNYAVRMGRETARMMIRDMK